MKSESYGMTSESVAKKEIEGFGMTSEKVSLRMLHNQTSAMFGIIPHSMRMIMMLKKGIIMHGSCMRGFSEDRSSFRSLSGEQSKVRTGLLKSRACVIGGASEQFDLDIEQRKWSRFGH